MAERGEVRHQVHVTVAPFPVGEFVSADRFHLHVDRQQVVAAVRTVVGDLFQEETRVEPLAGQSAVEIGETDQHGVDRAFVESGLEFFQGETAGWAG